MYKNISRKDLAEKAMNYGEESEKWNGANSRTKYHRARGAQQAIVDLIKEFDERPVYITHLNKWRNIFNETCIKIYLRIKLASFRRKAKEKNISGDEFPKLSFKEWLQVIFCQSFPRKREPGFEDGTSLLENRET
jgi:hypothetical protein